MTSCLIKAIVFYFLLVSMTMFIKPQHFYYDVDKTKLKPWNLFIHTRNINDLLTFSSCVIIICLLSIIVANVL